MFKVAIIIGQLCQRLPVANLRLREWPDVYCLSTVYDTFNAASFNMTEHCKAKPLHCTDNKISIRLTTKTRKQSTTQRKQQNITLRYQMAHFLHLVNPQTGNCRTLLQLKKTKHICKQKQNKGWSNINSPSPAFDKYVARARLVRLLLHHLRLIRLTQL